MRKKLITCLLMLLAISMIFGAVITASIYYGPSAMALVILALAGSCVLIDIASNV